MKIISLAVETHGGAGVSALRLHQGLLNAEQNSELIFGSGSIPLAYSQRFILAVNVLGRYADRLLDQFVWNARKPGASLFLNALKRPYSRIEPILASAIACRKYS